MLWSGTSNAHVLTAGGCSADASGVLLVYENTSHSQPNNTPNYGALGINFSVDMLPHYIEYPDMFQEYRINKIKVKLIPHATQTSVPTSLISNTTDAPTNITTGTTSGIGLICHSALDFTDAAVPSASETGIQNLQEYNSYRARNVLSRGGKPLTWYFKPCINMQVDGFSGTAKSIKPSPWLSSTDLTVPHNGLKLLFDSAGGIDTLQASFRLEATLYMQWRGTQ